MSFRDDILKHIDSVPAMPIVAVRLAKLLKNPDESVDTIKETVQYDPVLTARAIQMANSAAMGSGKPVSSLKSALVRLGNDQLLKLALASTVKPSIDKELDGYMLDPGELWKHSVAAAVTAEVIAKELDKDFKEEAFTAGLLIDTGKIVMNLYVGDNAVKIETVTDGDKISFTEAEEKILGISHTEVGAEMLRQWNFPEEIIAAVRWHHEPDKAGEFAQLATVVHIADSLAMMLGIGLGRDGLRYNLEADLLKSIGLTVLRLEYFASLAYTQYMDIMSIFDES